MATVAEHGSGWRPGQAMVALADRAPQAAAPADAGRHVTVVYTDIVGSTGLAARAGASYPSLLVRHRELIAGAVARRGGSYLSHAGDGTMAVFDRPDDALGAAVDAQRALGAEAWPAGLGIRVRMGVHAGEVYDVDGEPVGLAINQGARIMAVAHAGQVVVTDAVASAVAGAGEAVARDGGPDLVLADAGHHDLRDHATPVRLRQVVADGLTVVLPGPRVAGEQAPCLSATALGEAC
jgi:class 3 adenylate cyclase